jgi:HPt (histidine-containing phosphotransfer) domain-containing protein
MEFQKIADQLGLDLEDIYEITELFVDTAPSEIQKLIDADQTRNPRLAAEAAHSLKGSTSTLGMTEIALLAQTVVQHGRENSVDELKTSIPNLINALNAVVIQIRQQIAAHKEITAGTQ